VKASKQDLEFRAELWEFFKQLCEKYELTDNKILIEILIMVLTFALAMGISCQNMKAILDSFLNDYEKNYEKKKAEK
jgi:hypothetical protein